LKKFQLKNLRKKLRVEKDKQRNEENPLLRRKKTESRQSKLNRNRLKRSAKLKRREQKRKKTLKMLRK